MGGDCPAERPSGWEVSTMWLDIARWPGYGRLLDHRRLGREALVLRLGGQRAVQPGVAHNLGQELEAHRRQRAFPQLARRLAFGDEAPVLRGDGARVPAVGQVIDGASRDRVAFLDRPFHGRDAAMPRQQRRVIADAAQARVGQRLVAHARVRVRGDDEIRARGDGFSRHDLRILEHVDFDPGRLRRERQPVVRGRRDDARKLDPFLLAQRLEHLMRRSSGIRQLRSSSSFLPVQPRAASAPRGQAAGTRR